MKTIEVKLYQFDELSDTAKERALSWWSEACYGDSFITESVTEEFHEALTALGFDVKTRRGSTEADLCWDTNPVGAAFSASWSAGEYMERANKRDALLKDRPAGVDCQSNDELHRIAGELSKLAIAFPDASGSVTASNRYCGMTAEFDHGDTDDTDDTDAFADICNDLAFQFAKDIDAEITYQVYGDGALESIRANEYEFTEEGERA